MTPRYQLISRVAESGFSTIDHAFDRERAVEVALKRPRRTSKDGAGQFQTEMRVLGSVQHEHIISLLDTGSDELGSFLALEWIEGATLDQRIRDRALTETELGAVLHPLLQALVFLHSAGFAHADLNASNIMISTSRHLKLIDFGNAAALADRQPRSLGDSNIGSIHHMAPELFSGQPPDVRSDLYAVGIIAFHALARRLPFDGENKAQIITAHLHQARPPLPSSSFDSWVGRLIARDPASRPASAGEALESLP